MTAISALETLLSDFLDSFGRGVLGSSSSRVRCLRSRWVAVNSMGAVLVEVRDEPEGTLGKGTLGSARRVCGVRRSALRLRRDTTLARWVGAAHLLQPLPRRQPARHGTLRARTPSRADVLPDAEGATPLGQGVRGRGDGALHCLADLDALGRCEVWVVGGARVATDFGSLGSRALVLHHVLDLPGERVSRPAGESSRGEGTERGEHRTLPLREASHVREHVLVLPWERTAARFVVGSPALRGTAGSPGVEDPPRRADARERTGRIRRVRTEGEVPAHSPRLVSIRRTARKVNSANFALTEF